MGRVKGKYDDYRYQRVTSVKYKKDCQYARPIIDSLNGEPSFISTNRV
jgi:hypothetical protein